MAKNSPAACALCAFDGVEIVTHNPLAHADTLAALIERGKTEILADVRTGRIPITVASFSELHDFVDANEYGGLCDSPEVNHEDSIRVQNALDTWIRAGGLR